MRRLRRPSHIFHIPPVHHTLPFPVIPNQSPTDSKKHTKEFNLWGYRETFFANLAINAPVLSPLFRRAFWKRGPYVGARHWERGAGQQQQQQRQQEQQPERGEEGGLAGAAPRRRRMGVLTSLLEHSSLFASSVVSSLRSRMTGSRDREGEEEEDRGVTESHPTAGAATAVSDRNLEAGQGAAEVVAEVQGGDGGGGSGPGEIVPSRRSLQVEAYDEKREVNHQETTGMEPVTGEEMVAGSASDEARFKGKET